ncbi:MAG TPA: hypothetical protein VJQ47_17970 [Steroidobacteraceae bacterium]|nr:hypothetical protein [Steroidobacteraceae bacterium]
MKAPTAAMTAMGARLSQVRLLPRLSKVRLLPRLSKVRLLP